jgi:hypothetical protein
MFRVGVYFVTDMSAASVSSFSPTILTQLGWKARTAQVMSIPLWVTGIVIELGGTFASQKLNIRWPFILGGLVLSTIGWAIQLSQVNPASIRYFGMFCITGGTFIQFPLTIAWLQGNLRGRAYLAMGTAMQLGLGNCANFVASNVFITAQVPRYPVGFGTGLAITVAGIFLVLVTALTCKVHNSRLAAKREATPSDDSLWDDQLNYMYVW